MYMHKMSDVTFNEGDMLKKGYNAKDLLGKTFVVHKVSLVKGDNGEYLTCDITGDGIEEGKPFNTGAHNISVKLWNAREQGKLPVEVTVVKLGNSNALDIE